MKWACVVRLGEREPAISGGTRVRVSSVMKG